jgi:hypothetical protein
MEILQFPWSRLCPLNSWFSTPPLNGLTDFSQSQSQSYFTTGGLPPSSSFWRQAPWDSRPAFFQLKLGVIALMKHPPWREDGSVFYNCCRPSPAKSFSGPSPAGLMTTFDCLRFETLPAWWASSPYLYPPRTGLPSYTPIHCVPFSSPPMSRRVTV